MRGLVQRNNRFFSSRRSRQVVKKRHGVPLPRNDGFKMTAEEVAAGEARRIIHLLETEVRLGYFLHMEADWRDVLRSAYEISAEHGFEHACRAADLLHVAYAKELASDRFVSFDADQSKLAKAAGLESIALFE